MSPVRELTQELVEVLAVGGLAITSSVFEELPTRETKLVVLPMVVSEGSTKLASLAVKGCITYLTSDC